MLLGKDLLVPQTDLRPFLLQEIRPFLGCYRVEAPQIQHAGSGLRIRRQSASEGTGSAGGATAAAHRLRGRTEGDDRALEAGAVR